MVRPNGLTRIMYPTDTHSVRWRI